MFASNSLHLKNIVDNNSKISACIVCINYRVRITIYLLAADVSYKTSIEWLLGPMIVDSVI